MLLQWIIHNLYMFSLCQLSNAVTVSAMNISSNKSINIRHYASLIHLKYIYSLQAIMNNMHNSCGYVLSHVKTDYA